MKRNDMRCLRFRITLVLTLVFQMLASGPAGAQSTSADVTFAVPLNLTNLATDITKVRVTCSFLGVGSSSPTPGLDRAGAVEIPVTGRQVITTAQVVVMVPPTAIGAGISAGTGQRYTCALDAYSAALGWGHFLDRDTTGSFKTTQPVTTTVGGTFQW
jgi:hypothetical protein